MNYAYNYSTINSESENQATQLAKLNYFRLAKLIINNALEILRNFIMDVESIGEIKIEQTPEEIEPYTTDNALYDICYDHGHLSSIQGLRMMIEPCFENLRIINNKKDEFNFTDNDVMCWYPDFEETDSLFDKIKKVYQTILESQYEKISIPETSCIFKILHEILYQLEMSMYIPF